ncbi:helix-turn-helix domain-containing protein [Listeria ilorinensis]|uniref:helix-turn-helix domain-containing protein n=1 Tax=Listeria ilorinensis TaxID=2867439 RepID=UPI001EF72A32|nr:helix-turn-helix transcriptional regulator [Listeria ilorinensis]
MKINQRVARLRKERGYTQKEFAELILMDDSTLSKSESGKRAFRDYELEKIADILDVSLDFLFNRSKTKPDIIVFHLNEITEETEKELLHFIENRRNSQK